MADVQRKLVHKQFNSPIGLYSQNNIQETLDRELRTLSNGAVGINFDDPSTVRTGNLANSAVLRALEEEERQQKTGVKRVAWPPPPDSQAPGQTEPNSNQQGQAHTQYQPQATQGFRPLDSAPVTQQQQQQQHQTQPREYQIPIQIEQPQAYPGYITPLRKEAPISQVPAPVYASQPVAASYQGGINMRGDQKWPPEEVKKQSEIDNEQRKKIAQGPVFRPKRVAKDYSQFFAQHALNSTYPGYRAPPGTQHIAGDSSEM